MDSGVFDHMLISDGVFFLPVLTRCHVGVEVMFAVTARVCVCVCLHVCLVGDS